MSWRLTFDGTRRDAAVVAKERETNEFASSWEGGTVVNFDDLPPDFFGKIAEKDKTANWYGVYLWPTGDDARMYHIVYAAAEHAGIAPPPGPQNMRDAQKLLDMFERTAEVEDQPMMDGFPQTPDGPESGSISTSPGDTNGLETSPEDSPSDGS